MSQIPSKELENVFKPAMGEAKENGGGRKNLFDSDELDNVFRMFEEVEEAWRKPLSGGAGVLEDLENWSQRLATLGEATCYLGEYGKEQDVPPEIFENFGYIIKDYANAINCVVGNKKFRNYCLRQGMSGFSLSKHLKTYEIILQGAFINPLEKVEGELKEVEAFVESEATPSFSLLNKLRQLRETIIERIEKGNTGPLKSVSKVKGDQ